MSRYVVTHPSYARRSQLHYDRWSDTPRHKVGYGTFSDKKHGIKDGVSSSNNYTEESYGSSRLVKSTSHGYLNENIGIHRPSVLVKQDNTQEPLSKSLTIDTRASRRVSSEHVSLKTDSDNVCTSGSYYNYEPTYYMKAQDGVWNNADSSIICQETGSNDMLITKTYFTYGSSTNGDGYGKTDGNKTSDITFKGDTKIRQETIRDDIRITETYYNYEPETRLKSHNDGIVYDNTDGSHFSTQNVNVRSCLRRHAIIIVAMALIVAAVVALVLFSNRSQVIAGGALLTNITTNSTNTTTITPPDIYDAPWSQRNVSLCFRWYADGDGRYQCGMGSSNELCALTNDMTPYYRDNTDGGDGGCQMAWGIQSDSNASLRIPNWINDIQICYSWYADGEGGQCSPTNGIRCAYLGQYTAYYRDDTDGRGDGCQMRWSLVVPGDGPSWLKAAKLCYQWYPDGDGGQCGGGAPRRQCQTAGTWTSYYRDDTDGRGGGCRMRWGIQV